ncbi:MAG TPA: 16S rRNA (adenine(1518)-N(6)/adenine(1519)-N(6))-dimethyltransferase RsmA [Terriglobales bacterium]|nr:16S rRNA (adenine(1518)-N(6)/adenine(1519)-N(6))-dimethyltransferase RsmA [Terriglobales bacterium]
MSTRKAVNAPRRFRPTHKPKLGQNFLVDAVAARRIVEALGDIQEDVVVEIGPGRGALTRLLAERAGRLIAIEFDRTLAERLRADFAGRENVEIVSADILRMQLGELLAACTSAGKKVAKLVGNIPYYITSDILLWLFAQHECISLAVLMMQKEVADRLVAEPGSRDYGLLSVTTRLFADPERLFTLAPGAFSPAPQVHSSVLRLRTAPKAHELHVDADDFLNFCRLAFAHKRKTLFNNLRRKYSEEQIRRALRKLEIREDVRAEALSLENLARVFGDTQHRSQ